MSSSKPAAARRRRSLNPFGRASPATRWRTAPSAYGLGSLTAAENMSVLPKVDGQSVSGAGGSPAVPSTTACRNVLIVGQTAAFRASLNTDTAPELVAATVL